MRKQCRRWWTSVTHTCGSWCQWCYLCKLHSFNLLWILTANCLYNTLTTNQPSGVCTSPCAYLLITDSCVMHNKNLLSTLAHCLVITLSMQRDMVNFAWGSIVRSIGVSRYTCFTCTYGRASCYLAQCFGRVWSIVFLLMCLKNDSCFLHPTFCACYLWPWLTPFLMAVQ